MITPNKTQQKDAMTKDDCRFAWEMFVARHGGRGTAEQYTAFDEGYHAAALASRSAATEPVRVIDGKFHVERNQIVKTSSGEVVPEDEPLLLMRGRDRLALPTIEHYRKLCALDGCNDFQLGLVDDLIRKFSDYAADSSRMKQPGVTRGAPWTPAAEPSERPSEGRESGAPWPRLTYCVNCGALSDYCASPQLSPTGCCAECTHERPGVGQGTPIKLNLDGSPMITAQEVIDLRKELSDLRTVSAELLRRLDACSKMQGIWHDVEESIARLREVLSRGAEEGK